MTTLVDSPAGANTGALAAAHQQELAASAIAPAVAAERGYVSITDPRTLPPQFTGAQRQLTGLLIPIRDVAGRVATYQLKPDQPRRDAGDKPIKYETAAGGRTCLDVPAAVRPLLDDASVPLWITEGSEKVDSALSNGIPCVIGLSGVWMWQRHKRALPDWREIALDGREVVIAFDSDVMRKDAVRDPLDELAEYLKLHGARLRYGLLRDLADGAKCGLDDWFAAGGTREGLAPLLVDTLPGATTDWPPPVPLLDLTGTPFPVESLPDALFDYVTALAEATQTPPDLTGIAVLGNISAAAGGKYVVHGPIEDWTEPVHIQTLAVAPPASGKSPVFDKVTEPILTWEQERRREEKPEVEEWASKYRALEKARAQAEADCSKAGRSGEDPADLDRIREAAVLELSDHERTRPYLTRVIVDDATAEAVTTTLFEQGSAAVMAAEPTFFSNISGRYGDGPNMEVLLKGHAGDAISVSRKGRDSEDIARACLTVCLAAQPGVVTALGKVPGFSDRGGDARLLVGFAPDRRGFKNLDAAPMPGALRREWEQTLRRILEHIPERENGGALRPWHLRMSSAAHAAFRRFQEAFLPQMQPGGSLRDMSDWSGKMEGTVLRLAALLHIAMVEVPEAEEIVEETVLRAIVLAGYYVDHARIMYQLMAGRGSETEAAEVLAAIIALGGRTTRREVQRKLHGRLAFRRSSDLDAPLALLEDTGWIRTWHSGNEKGGRRSRHIELNPLADRDKTDKTSRQSVLPAGTVGFVNAVPASGAERGPALPAATGAGPSPAASVPAASGPAGDGRAPDGRGHHQRDLRNWVVF